MNGQEWKKKTGRCVITPNPILDPVGRPSCVVLNMGGNHGTPGGRGGAHGPAANHPMNHTFVPLHLRTSFAGEGLTPSKMSESRHRR